MTNQRSGSMPFLRENLDACFPAIHRKILHKIEKSCERRATKQKNMWIQSGVDLLWISSARIFQPVQRCHCHVSPSPYLALPYLFSPVVRSLTTMTTLRP